MTWQFVPPELKMFPLNQRLNACRHLADFARQSFEGSGPPGGWEGERMTLAVWARAAGTFEAVLLLGEHGFGDQVGMLSRALFESTIDAYWIAKRPVKAQRLGELHMRLLRVIVAEHWNARQRRDGDPVLPIDPDDLFERPKMIRLFRAKAQNHWTRMGLPDRIKFVDELVPQAYKGELDDRYEEDNRLANILLHGASVAINDRITADQLGNIRIHVGASDQHLANGLRHAYWSYTRHVRLVAHRRDPAAVSEVERLDAETWPVLQTITAPRLKKIGPTGDCPCGSGRQVKDCHGAL
jgi:hypothetical protein